MVQRTTGNAAQIEDERLETVLIERTYPDATYEVLNKHGGLWFNDESYIISKKRDHQVKQ
jgi:hypothetical protein